ncbi:phage major capsid protein [Aliikangiella marina]|uniref:Phage major capsid protein n=1 Tax=Aliikangiella marina TaxID=1712262 RepID=A0A545THG1_9GAMM|nr:phage major capsid protein [Aliikangiella marina]TQV76667.1 phage major capsid protein [Aliikangiella marina]
MSKTIQELREQRQALAKEVRQLVDNNEGSRWEENNCQASYDDKVTQIDRIEAEIDRKQKALDIDAKAQERVRQFADQNNLSEDEAAAIKAKNAESFVAFAKHGWDGLDEDQVRAAKERNESIKNTMSTGTGSEGGFTVAPEFAATLLETLKEYGGMRQAATVISTSTGTDLPWPTTNATAEEGEIVGENADVSDEDADFSTISIGSQKYSSKVITVPFELLQDTAINIEAHIAQRLQTRLGRITNRMYTTGTGIGQPNGLFTAAGVGRIGQAGQTTSLTYDDLIDLEHSVDPAYRRMGASWMFHDTTLRDMKKIKDNDGRPIWLPGYDVGEGNSILGYQYTINQDAPQMAASAKSVAFGDLNKYVIRDVMQFLFFRMADSAFTRKGQVGFLAFMRSGGNLIDVGGAVKCYQNSAT